MPKYEGLIAAPFTAMHQNGSLNEEMIAEQARALIADGVTGAFICGTTGEGLSLTSAERRTVAEAWREATPETFNLFVHVAHPAIAEARALAMHARDIGANAIAAMPASPFADATVEGVTAYIAPIAEAAAELPFFYYHIPSVSSVRISVRDLLAFAGPKVPNLAGVKFTHEDLMDYMRAQRLEGGRYELLFGRDEIYLAGLTFGARAAVGSTYNFAAPLFHEITAAFRANDLATARTLQHQLQELLAVMLTFPGLAAQKRAMRLLGQDLGPIRAPGRSLSAEETARLDDALERVGFLALSGREPVVRRS